MQPQSVHAQEGPSQARQNDLPSPLLYTSRQWPAVGDEHQCIFQVSF